MALTDPIADMLTVLRNASSARKDVAEVKNSRLSEEIVKLLKREGFVSNYKLVEDRKQGLLRVYLKYGKDNEPAIAGIKRISRPGRRAYKAKEDIPLVYGGLGVAIVSTSKGVITDKEARERGVGGEILCCVW